jgi:hypothetical protein
MLGLTLSPLLRSRASDSFPLSTYPMFSQGRREPTAVVERAVGVTEGGARRPIPPRLVGSDEVLQARAIVARTAARGAGAARALCKDIAARLPATEGFADVAWVELRTDTFDAVAFFAGREEPSASKVHARCKVGAP